MLFSMNAPPAALIPDGFITFFDGPRETSRRSQKHRFTKDFPTLLTGFPHLIFAVPQQLKDIHLQLARGGAVGLSVDALFG